MSCTKTLNHRLCSVGHRCTFLFTLMDTTDKIAELKRLREVCGKWKELLEQVEEVQKQTSALSTELGKHLKKKTPKLSIPASQEECISAAKSLTELCDTKIADLEVEKNRLHGLLQNLVLQLTETTILMEKQIVVVRRRSYATEVERNEVIQHGRYRNRNIKKPELFEDFLLFYDKEVALGFSSQLQSVLLDMMKGQDAEMVEWFYGYQGWGDSVVFGGSAKEDVIFEEKRPVGLVTDGLILPLEIMSMVYSLADLEDCVALRQVDHSWYSAFQQMEHLWESKMSERNLWMKPNDPDLASWADCVLVFVARVKTWTPMNSMDAARLQGKTAEMKATVAVELHESEKLPSDFTSMVGHLKDNCGCRVCDNLHCTNSERRVTHFLNPWTHELSAKHTPKPELVHTDGYNNAIRYRDIGMVLPSSFTPESITTVTERSNYIYVYLNSEETALLPRDNPHIDCGLLERFTAVERQNTLLENLRLSNSLSNKYSAQKHPRARDDVNFRIWQRYAHYYERHLTVAFHNGLLWRLVDKQCLVPSFVDLHSPSEGYQCHPDRVIRIPIPMSTFLHQSDCRRFLVGERFRGEDAAVIDLATGVFTSVHKPFDREERFKGKIFFGFQNDKFFPRYMSEKATSRWNKLAGELAGEGPDELQ